MGLSRIRAPFGERNRHASLDERAARAAVETRADRSCAPPSG